MSSDFTWLLLLKQKIGNRDCLYWMENSCHRLLRANKIRRKELGACTLNTNNPEDIRKELLQLNLERRQEETEERHQLGQLVKANIRLQSTIIIQSADLLKTRLPIMIQVLMQIGGQKRFEVAKYHIARTLF